jgi:tetratricopeptide (TPR) repeat protein
MQNSSEIKNEGIENSIIINQVNQILGMSFDYNSLLSQLKTQQKLFDRTPEDEMEERLQISAELNRLKDFIEQFKRDVLALAETFNKIEINTDRLRRAKEFFDKGEFGEARAVLETELEQMQDEQTLLLKGQEYYENEILPKLKHNSDEFYLLATATKVNYENPNRFEDTCKYFEDSIKSNKNKYNLFNYAWYLQEQKHFEKSFTLYSEYLNEFSSQLSDGENATILNNLGVHYKETGRLDDAENNYEKALKIRRKLAESDPQFNLPLIVLILSNLALLHTEQNKIEKAFKEYDEILPICRSLAQTNDLLNLHLLGTALNNLALLHIKIEDFDAAFSEVKEALSIRRIIAVANPAIYLPFVARTLTNLAELAFERNDFDKAILMTEEAIEILSKLILENFTGYYPDLARNYFNLARAYQFPKPQREQSIKYGIESLTILLPYVNQTPVAALYYVNALNVLSNWELSDEEINRMIEEKKKVDEQT